MKQDTQSNTLVKPATHWTFDELMANAPAVAAPPPYPTGPPKIYRDSAIPNIWRRSPNIIASEGREFRLSYCHRVDARSGAERMAYSVSTQPWSLDDPVSLETIDAAITEALAIAAEFRLPGVLTIVTPAERLIHIPIIPSGK